MIIAFITTSFFVFLFLAIMWSKKSGTDVLIKTILFIMAFWSGFLIMKLLPAIELSGQMRLL